MKRPAFPLVLLVLGVAAAAVGTLLPADLQTPLYRSLTIGTKCLAFLGCAAAAIHFSPGDRLFAAWGALAASFAVLAARDLLVVTGRLTPLLHSVLPVAANVLGPLGVGLFARAWGAGAEQSGLRRVARAAGIVVGVGVALVLAAHPLYIGGLKLLDGDLAQVPTVASALGDALALSLVVPLVLTALSLRGGLLVRAWAYLAAAQVAWLVYDALVTAGPLVGLEGDASRAPREAARTLACLLSFLAGLAQRGAVSSRRG